MPNRMPSRRHLRCVLFLFSCKLGGAFFQPHLGLVWGVAHWSSLRRVLAAPASWAARALHHENLIFIKTARSSLLLSGTVEKMKEPHMRKSLI